MIRRIASWSLTLGLVVAVMAGGWYFAPQVSGAFGWLRVGSAPQAQTVESAAADLTLVCPGAAIRSGGANGTKVGSFDRLGQAVVDYSASLPEGTTLQRTELRGQTGEPSALEAIGGKLSATAAPTAIALRVLDPNHVAEQSSNLLTATNYQMVGGSGVAMAGLLGAACQHPTGELTIVGADTSTGREALLLIANPSAVDLQVSVTAIASTATQGENIVTVAANQSIVFPVASLAASEQLVALKLKSNGSPFAAWVQQKTVRGTTAAGIDFISPVSTPSRNLVIPGFYKRGTSDASALIRANSNYADLTPAIALCNPSSQSATATVQVIGADSQALGTVLQNQLAAGVCTLSPLTGLKDGNYAVFIHSDQPISAALRLSRTDKTKTPITDFAWLTATSADASARSIVVPKSGISKLAIANPGNAPVVATVTNLTDGKTAQLSIGALNSATVEATPGSVLRLTSVGKVAASLVVDIDGQLSVIPLGNYANRSGSLTLENR